MQSVMLPAPSAPQQQSAAPGPSNGWVGWRHVGPLKSNFLAYGLDLKEQYGDAVRFRIGPIWVYILSHPDHFREVLVDRPQDFAKPFYFQRAMRPLLRGAIGIASGAAWAHRRKLVHAALAGFDLNRLAAPAARFAGRYVAPLAGTNATLGDALEKVLSAASVEATLGNDFDEHVDEIYDLTCQALDALAGQISGWAPLWAPTPRRRRITRAAARFEVLCEQARRGCVQRGGDPSQSLIAGLVAAEGEGRRGSPREVCEEAAMLFVGGKETAGPAATWMACLLARHPEVQDCAAQELVRVLGEREVTAGDLPRLKLLEAIYKEALRLYPPAFMFPREAVRATTIAGFPVPRRSAVCLFTYALHFDPRWWDAPDDFLPERFLDATAPDHSHAWLPFGLGKRACPGGRISTVQTLAAFAALLPKYRFVWTGGEREPAPLVYMGLRPPLDLPVRLERRV